MVRTFGRVCEPGLFACVCGFVALSRSVCVRASYAMLTFATTLCYALVTPTIHPWVPERHGFLTGNLRARRSPKFQVNEVIGLMSAKSTYLPSTSPVDYEVKATHVVPPHVLSTIDSVVDALHSTAPSASMPCEPYAQADHQLRPLSPCAMSRRELAPSFSRAASSLRCTRSARRARAILSSARVVSAAGLHTGCLQLQQDQPPVASTSSVFSGSLTGVCSSSVRALSALISASIQSLNGLERCTWRLMATDCAWATNVVATQVASSTQFPNSSSSCEALGCALLAHIALRGPCAKWAPPG